jgi:hypothetical protein
MSVDPRSVDPRGPRFAAAVTTLVLALVLLLVGTVAGTVLLAAQAGVFALGARMGPQASPYGRAFKRLIRPRLGPPAELEDVRPLRFAQAVGLGFAVFGLLGLAAGATLLTLVAVSLALAAAFLNAAFGCCLGCEVYLLLRRVAPVRARVDTGTAP